MTTAARTKRTTVAIEYPETDHMAENLLQRLMSEFLRPLIARFLAQVVEGELSKQKRYKALRARRPMCVGADQFWYYVEGQPKKSVSPDVYVISGVEPTAAPPSFKLWELERPPVFALEIVSSDVDKDYVVSPKAYALTGVEELLVYDPAAPVMADASQGAARVRWQVWRRSSKGAWDKALSTNADRVYCEALCCWLRVVGDGDQRRLRIATDAAGDELFLSEAEAERDAHARANETAKRERETAERERELKVRALVEVEHERALRKALETQLSALKRKPSAGKARAPSKRAK